MSKNKFSLESFISYSLTNGSRRTRANNICTVYPSRNIVSFPAKFGRLLKYRLPFLSVMKNSDTDEYVFVFTKVERDDCLRMHFAPGNCCSATIVSKPLCDFLVKNFGVKQGDKLTLGPDMSNDLNVICRTIKRSVRQ